MREEVGRGRVRFGATGEAVPSTLGFLLRDRERAGEVEMVGLDGEAAESSEMRDWRFARPSLVPVDVF